MMTIINNPHQLFAPDQAGPLATYKERDYETVQRIHNNS